MLEFFRKYQRFFLFGIAVIVIASFSFFGTFGAISSMAPPEQDRVLGKAIDASDVNLLEMQALIRFISADREDVANRQTAFNLLNDGVLRRDLIGTGIAAVLVEEQFDLVKEELEPKFQRMKTFKGYEHPEAPFLSAKGVWERFMPTVNREWSALQTEEGSGPELFTHAAKLYQLQGSFPSEWLRRILLMQEQQYKWLHPDPRLRQDDLSLFGFHSVTDWFGKRFVDLAAQFIHNAAIEAKQKGLEVSLEEAKSDLRRVFAESMEKIRAAKLPLQVTYKEQLQMLRMDESEAVNVWRKVLLFREIFRDAGESALIDRLPYSEFASVASEKALVDVYQWGQSLKLRTALDVLGLNTYLKAVSSDLSTTTLPRTFFSLEEVEKKTAELVEILYTAKVSAVDKREVALRAPLKEVWDFEIGEDGWKRLKKEFSFLQPLSANTSEERFQSLENLDPNRRTKVDLFARRCLVEKHPEWVKAALDAATGQEKQLVLSAGNIHLPHVENSERLGTLFKEILSSPEHALADLQQFDSGEAVFRFENIAKIADPKIKTLEEAKNDGSLDLLTTRVLEAEYSALKGKLAADLQKKAILDVKEELAALLVGFTPEALEKNHARVLATASQAWEELQKNSDSQWIRKDGEEALLAQFKAERIEKEISRTSQENWMTNEAFIVVPKQWSQVHVDEDGVSFFYLKEKIVSDEPLLKQLSFGKEMLVSDVQSFLAKQLMGRMLEKKVPLQIELEE